MSEDALPEMQARETPEMRLPGQITESKPRRSKARNILLRIGAVLSGAAVLAGVGAVVLVLATLATDHDYTAFFSLIFLPPGLLALVLGGIGLAVCRRRLSRYQRAKGLEAQSTGESHRDPGERRLIVAAVLMTAAFALGWGILGQPRNTQHLRLQYLLGRRTFEGATLIGADLGGANLARVRMAHCYLQGANLEGANLTESDLWLTDLSGANLSGANLLGVDLTGANLTGAQVTAAQLAKADSLKGATLSDGTVHE